MVAEDFKQFVKSAPEHLIYFMIEETAAYIENMGLLLLNKGIKPNDIAKIKNDFQEVSEKHELLQKTLVRFGVEKVYDKKGINFTTDYRQWYTHWNTWKKSLSKEDWSVVKDRLIKNENLAEFLPKHNWND